MTSPQVLAVSRLKAWLAACIAETRRHFDPAAASRRIAALEDSMRQGPRYFDPLRFSFGLCAVIALCWACTSMGGHDVDARRGIDFGPSETVSLCLLVDDGVSEQAAREIVHAAWRDEAPLYRLFITVSSVRRWPRPAFTVDGIIEALVREPLPPTCDRVLALIGRHLGDVIWGVIGLPEVLGAVDDNTSTHGYAVIQRASLNQLMMSPIHVVQHEIYHLLGCTDHFNMTACYDRIAAMKLRRRSERTEIFPAWDMINHRVLVSRNAVNARLKEIVRATEPVPAK